MSDQAGGPASPPPVPLSEWARLATTQGVRLRASWNETGFLDCSICGELLLEEDLTRYPRDIITLTDLVMVVTGHLVTHLEDK